MKTETSTTDKPAPFITPHEQKKAAAKVTKKKTSKAKVKETKAKERDAFGGLITSRMSKINQAVIGAGKRGITVPEVAKKTGEPAGLCSAQLSWIMTTKKLCTRREEKNGDGRKTFRYFAKV